MKQVDIENWCKIIDVSGYKMLIELYWSVDDDPVLHHNYVIKISSRFLGGDFSAIDFLIHDNGKNYTTEEAIEAFDNLQKTDLALLLSKWLTELEDPDRVIKVDINPNLN